MEKERVVSDQPDRISDYLDSFQSLDEYYYPKLPSSKFTYKTKRNGGKFVDDGVCDICGKKHQYVLIAPKTPKMCYKCYQSIRAYKSLLVDTLRLKRKKDLTLKDCKKIVMYMKTYSKIKLLALAALASTLSSNNKK